MREDGHIVLPREDYCLHYRDNSHSYWTCSGDPDHRSMKPRLVGCSSLGKGLDIDNSYLLRWAARQDHLGIATLLADHSLGEHDPLELRWLWSAESIERKLSESKLSYLHSRDRAAQSGTNVHTVFEHLAQGREDLITLDAITDPKERAKTEALFDWWEKRQPRPINVEQFVLSKEFSFAGRFDMRADIVRDNGITPARPSTALIDLKTSGFIGASYHAQLRYYDIGARECGVGSSDELLILQVKDDGTWKEIPCAVSEEEALASLTCYRAHRRLESARRAA